MTSGVADTSVFWLALGLLLLLSAVNVFAFRVYVSRWGRDTAGVVVFIVLEVAAVSFSLYVLLHDQQYVPGLCLTR